MKIQLIKIDVNSLDNKDIGRPIMCENFGNKEYGVFMGKTKEGVLIHFARNNEPLLLGLQQITKYYLTNIINHESNKK